MLIPDGLQVGVNSYVTADEALAYIRNNYESTEPERAEFEALTPEDQASALIKSCSAIDKLLFTGRKLRAGQLLSFPRTESYVPGVYFIPAVSAYADNNLLSGAVREDGLYRAQCAQIENALRLSYMKAVISDQAEVRLLGITSRSLGSVSESFGKSTVDAQRGRASEKVSDILRPWLSTSQSAF